MKKILKSVGIVIGLFVVILIVLFILWHIPFMKRQVKEDLIEATEGPAVYYNWSEFSGENSAESSFICLQREGVKSEIKLDCNIACGYVQVVLYKTNYKSYEDMRSAAANNQGIIDKTEFESVDKLDINASGTYIYGVENQEPGVYEIRISIGTDDTSCCVYAEKASWLYRREKIVNQIFEWFGKETKYET